MPKADKKKATKSDKKKSKAPAGLAAAPDEGDHRLADAARRLGPPDPGLETAVRAAHPDAELQREGAKVSSERIADEGERMVSKALGHLESKDPEVQQAARRAGLTRPVVALTAHVLLRLVGAVGEVQTARGKHSDRRQVTTLSLEAATAQGRVLKRATLERLALVRGADASLAATVARAAERAQTAAQLSAQLSSLAEVIGGLGAHPVETVRTLAAAKGLGADDVAELTQAVEAIAQASRRTSAGSTQREEQQALLDVLDGLCLVLLDDVLRSLRAMARATPKVRKPQLTSLASYFGSRGKADEEPEAPAPAG